MESVLNTKQASERLSISIRRVQALINSGKLPATKVGRDFVIQESDLRHVTERKAGRPAKPKTDTNGTNNNLPIGVAEKPFKTIFDVAPHLVGAIKSGLPTDLSSNKDYLKDLGKKSCEKESLLKRE